LSVTGLQKAKKEHKELAQKDSIRANEACWARQFLEAVQNALPQQGKSSASIHRSMYGRGSFELLRQRMLQAAA